MASLVPLGNTSAYWGAVLSVGGLLLLLSTTAYSAYELRAYEARVEKLQSLVGSKTVGPSESSKAVGEDNTVSSTSDVAALQKQVDALKRERDERSEALDDANKRAQAATTERDVYKEQASQGQAELVKLRDTIKALQSKLESCIIVN